MTLQTVAFVLTWREGADGKGHDHDRRLAVSAMRTRMEAKDRRLRPGGLSEMQKPVLESTAANVGQASRLNAHAQTRATGSSRAQEHCVNVVASGRPRSAHPISQTGGHLDIRDGRQNYSSRPRSIAAEENRGVMAKSDFFPKSNEADIVTAHHEAAHAVIDYRVSGFVGGATSIVARTGILGSVEDRHQ